MSGNPMVPELNWGARPHLVTGYLAITFLLGVFGVWSTATQISGAIVARGTVEVAVSQQVIQHPIGGVVKEILVRNGDFVRAGDVVIRLDEKKITSKAKVLETSLHGIDAAISRLLAERDGKSELVLSESLQVYDRQEFVFSALLSSEEGILKTHIENLREERALIVEEIGQIDNQISGYRAQIRAIESQQRIVLEELASKKKLLDKNLISRSAVLSTEKESARLLGNFGEMKSKMAALFREKARANIRLIGLERTRREKATSDLRDLKERRFELVEKIAALRDQIEQLSIRAPVSGKIHGTTVFALNSVIRAAAPIMFVVPQNQPTVVKARIEPGEVDQVYIGQPAILVFGSLGNRNSKEIRGTISELSADTYSDSKDGSRYYQADIKFSRAEFTEQFGYELRPGMPVDVFLATDKRTPFQFITRPFTRFFDKAFRES